MISWPPREVNHPCYPKPIMRTRRWPWVALGVGIVAGGTALGLLAVPQGGPQTDGRPGAALYRAHCATCHGVSGRGDSWRARLLFLRPGDFTDPKAMRALSDDFLFQIIKHGGSSFGKPGMPSFGFHLTDEEIRSLVAYVRTFSAPQRH